MEATENFLHRAFNLKRREHLKNKIIVAITLAFSLFFIIFVVRTTNELSSAQFNILKSKNVIDATDLIFTRLLVTDIDIKNEHYWINDKSKDHDWLPIKIPTYQIVRHPNFRQGNYAYYRINIPKGAFNSLKHLKNETSLYLQSIFFNHFEIYINGQFFRTYKPENPGEYKVFIPVSEMRDNIVAIKAYIKTGDTGIDSRNQIMLGKGLEFNEIHSASYKAQTAYQLVFILCKGSILFIFALIFLLLKVDRSFEKFFVFGICTLIEELIAGDYLYGPLNFNQMVYLYNAVNIGGAVALFLFFGDLIDLSSSKKVIVLSTLFLSFITFIFAVDSLHFNYVVDLSKFMKVWNLIFVLIQLYYLPKIIKSDKVLFLGLLVTISLSLWSALFSINIGLNFKAYGNLLLFFIVAYQTFVLFRRVQEELLQKDRLLFEQEKDVIIGKTASLFAHDVRKPLEQMKLIMDRISSGNTDRVFIETAKNEIDISISSVDQHVRDIMNFSKTSEMGLTEISFYKVLSHAIKQVMSIHQEMNLNLEYELKADVRIYGDDSRLSGILVNLLSNGVEAIRDLGGKFDGTIIFKTSLNKDQFIFQIFNDGPEIAETNLSNVFKPLFTQGKANGTGLGLASVVKSVNLHNGSINVENLPGKGVQFNVSFTKGILRDEIGDYNFKTHSTLYNYNLIPISVNKSSDNFKILILEGSAFNRRLINDLLDGLSIDKSIHVASNPAEAEELIRKKRFDLYVMNSQDGGDQIHAKFLNFLSDEVIVYKENLPTNLKEVFFLCIRNKKRILYVDDTKLFRVAWQMFHGESNITCLSSPEEALASIVGKNEKYDIFVIDYHFSNSSLDGIALAKKIRMIIPDAKILISSSIDQKNTEFLSVGKSDYEIRKFF